MKELDSSDTIRLQQVNDLLQGDQLIVEASHEILWVYQAILHNGTNGVFLGNGIFIGKLEYMEVQGFRR